MEDTVKQLLTDAEMAAKSDPQDKELELILMVGLPRSGKTAFARGFIEDNPGTAIVNPDSIRLALHGERFNKKAEPVVWATARYMVESLFLAGHHTVIVDATNNTEKRRNEWVKWFGDTATVSCVFVGTPAEECIRRALAVNDEEIVPIIERMDEESDWYCSVDEGQP